MNILSIPQFSNFSNITTYKKHSNSSHILNTLKQDTVSFTGNYTSSIEDSEQKELKIKRFKEIEEFKKMNPAGQYDIPLKTIISICCKYFGFTMEDGEHIKLTGPYGQVTMIDNKTPVDAGSANDFIEAIQRADDYNGELIFFPKNKTQEDIDRWKKKIYSEKPVNNNKNIYAENLKKIKQAEQKAKIKKEEKATNEEIRALREKLAFLNLPEIEDKLNNLSDRFKSAEKDIKEDKVDIQQEKISAVEKMINSKITELNKIKKIENKLNQNKKITKEEKAQITQFDAQKFDLTELSNQIEKLEELFLVQIEKKDVLITEIKSIIENYKIENNQILEKIQEIETVLKNKKIIIAKSQKENISNQIKETIKKIKENTAKINKYKNIDTSKKTPTQLETKIDELENIIAENETLYKNVTTDYEENILPILNEEKTTTNNASKLNTNSDEKIKVNSQETQLISNQKTIKTETQKNQEQINQQEIQIKKLKDSITKKLAPLPLPNIIEKLSQITDENFDSEQFELIKTQKIEPQAFINELIKSICTSDDYITMKNATKFALLESIQKLSANQNSRIYTLNLKQLKELYNAIEKRQKEVLIPSENEPIKITLTNLPDLNKLNTQVSEFNNKIASLEPSISTKIIDEVLQYSPQNISKKELKEAKNILLEEGCYYKLLLNNDDENLTKMLLQTFWNKFKNKTGKDFTAEAISIYQQRLIEKQNAIMQQIKLKSIEEIDWSL